LGSWDFYSKVIISAPTAEQNTDSIQVCLSGDMIGTAGCAAAYKTVPL